MIRMKVVTMAYATDIHANGVSHSSHGLIEGLKQRFAHYRLVRRTYNELNALSNRELADMGLHRSQITSLAIEAANEHFGAK